jgi:hypothetical protein
VNPDPGFSRAVTTLVNRIQPLLAGKHPEVQGCALHDLVALWIAGHFVLDDPGETSRVRDDLLRMHCDQIREMVAFYAEHGCR